MEEIFITSSKTIIIGNRSLVVLCQKISHKISTKLYHSIPFLIWRNVGTCTWIYYIRRGYTDLSHLFFFFNWHVFPEFSKLNDTFIFLEEDGRLFIIDNFKKLGFLSGMPFLYGSP